MAYILDFIKERLFKPRLEPEYEEVVEHDTVLEIVDGKLVEVTGDDLEEGR